MLAALGAALILQNYVTDISTIGAYTLSKLTKLIFA